MADTNKFEKMLELLVNEDKEAAEELFHEIVVEKSRDIYESLLEDDEEVEESDDEDLDESDDEDLDEDDSEEVEEGFNLDEFEVEADPMAMGGDATDDMMGDLEGGDDEDDDDMDMDMDDEGGEDDMEDRVMDLEDALDDLKAEFEKMMGDDEGGDEEDDMDMDIGDEEEDDEDEDENEAYAFESDDEEVEESDDEEVEETRTPKNANEEMREYVEKVAGAKMGDNGTNNRSAVAGKNDMGGTTANTVRADTSSDPESGAGAKVKGSALNDQTAKEDNAGNVNVPGGKAGKSGFKKSEPGHGAEKKGKPDTADKSATSTLNKVSSRAK